MAGNTHKGLPPTPQSTQTRSNALYGLMMDKLVIPGRSSKTKHIHYLHTLFIHPSIWCVHGHIKKTFSE